MTDCVHEWLEVEYPEDDGRAWICLECGEVTDENPWKKKNRGFTIVWGWDSADFDNGTDISD